MGGISNKSFPLIATFGSKDAKYFRLPEPLDSSSAPNFVRHLDDNLRLVREKSLNFNKT